MLLPIATAASPWAAFVIIGVLVWVAGFIAVMLWMVLGQREYIRRYRLVHRLRPDELPLSDEMTADQLRRLPFGLPTKGYDDRFEVLFTAQADYQLEQQRQRMLLRMAAAAGYGLGGIILLLIVSS